MWNENTSDLVKLLLSMKKGNCWITDNPLTDTSRACSALAGIGGVQSDAVEWILNQQENDNWNGSEIDTAYALMALGDSGIINEAGCEWLVRNYGKEWEHAGTTSLIITALAKQDSNGYRSFIDDRAGWLLSKRSSGGWNYTATSNLAIQALIFAGVKDVDVSIRWLLGKQKSDNWGDITSTSLALISLKMHMDKVNSA